ncbi:PASTA domain-containing protein [Bifidobacterium sp. ESL0728]|uniref:PASTA domain-containing protein n=1 Tax=Bifidobacterium sp. ESL0728 TaxID=2983220 RepID=UPI0023FA3941|nr:PASTA domain-containing protein [Bifidobacterium sp. ESL0728]WEV58990.1 PASTA domain-containing protein [Bifidobacterium sp. ESL0728]
MDTPTGPKATAAVATVTTAAKANSKKRLIIIIATIVVVALVAAGAGFGTYKAQLWGGKTVPSPANLGIAKSSKTHEFTAADVEASLHKRGFKTVNTPTFSGKPKGTFLKYRSIDPNKRYSTGKDRITIISSNGPGVPKGTKGQSVKKVVKTLADMNVPVHYHEVVVTDQKTPADTVVASYPTDGQAVSDTKTGINIGVAKQAKGVGYDIVGQDKDQAKQQYASAGFKVTLKPRFSSKARVGKIVDSNPKPGTEADGGDLTLYYGIDASGFKDAVSQENVNPEDNGIDFDGTTVVGDAAPVDGHYCTNSGKCIDFIHDPKMGDKPSVYSSEDVSTSKTNTFEKNLLFCGAIQQAYCSSSMETGTKPLYEKGSGAFELAPYDASTGFTCGNTFIEGDAGSGCVNGKQPSEFIPYATEHMSGAHYDMGPLYVYFPVGSDVSKVVNSNYFDKDAVTKAEKQKKIDTSRPFFIRRDKSLYDKTSLDVTSTMTTPNPFLPTFGTMDDTKLLPVKPAPSDETAYYLVEDPQLDWGSLPEYVFGGGNGSKIDKPDAGNSPKANAQPQVTAQNATPDQITAAVQKGDDSLIAGKYCTNGGHCLQLSKTGQLTGGSREDMLGIDSTQLTLSTTSQETTDARNVKPGSPFLEFRGSDNDYLCKNGTTGLACKNGAETTPEIDRWPAHIVYVFKGGDTSSWYAPGTTPPIQGFMYDSVESGRKPAPTDRAYIYPVGWHMTVVPYEDTVYYFQG